MDTIKNNETKSVKKAEPVKEIKKEPLFSNQDTIDGPIAQITTKTTNEPLKPVVEPQNATCDKKKVLDLISTARKSLFNTFSPSRSDLLSLLDNLARTIRNI